MKENPGKIATVLSVSILFYLISPPIVFKASQVTGLPMSERFFGTVYAPLLPLVENVKPYAWLIQTEAEFLRLD